MLIGVKELEKYQNVQAIAKKTMELLAPWIRPGQTEEEIALEAKKIMLNLGVDEFWYHDIPAMVFSGERTVLFSREHLFGGERRIMEHDIVWIDLAPSLQGCWGDLTRTLVVSGTGVVKEKEYDALLNHPKAGEYVRLVRDAQEVQHDVLSGISPSMSFDDIFKLTERAIAKKGYVNPDVRNNYGHTLARNLAERRFIVKGERTPVRGKMIAFEPQIMKPSGRYSARIEDVFYCDDGGKVVVL